MNTTLTAQRQGISHEKAPERRQKYALLGSDVSGSGFHSQGTRRIPGTTYLPISEEDYYLRSACGCIHIPDILNRIIDQNKGIFCPQHGWQKPWRRASHKEISNHLLGRPLDFELELPDTPPF